MREIEGGVHRWKLQQGLKRAFSCIHDGVLCFIARIFSSSPRPVNSRCCFDLFNSDLGDLLGDGPPCTMAVQHHGPQHRHLRASLGGLLGWLCWESFVGVASLSGFTQ